MKKKFTLAQINRRLLVTVGIPAFNSEKNIKKLVLEILAQKGGNFRLSRILVYSDHSTDNTVGMARSVKDPRVKVISSRKNHGFAYGVQTLLRTSKTDITVLFNDDITLIDNYVLSRLVEPFALHGVGLVSGEVKPLPPKTFIERAALSSFNGYARIRASLNNGNNRYTCDGKILVLSRNFSKQLNILSEPVGNVDTYIYFTCKKLGLKYVFVKKPIVEFRLPQTAKDLFAQTKRSNATRSLMQKRFPELYVHDYPMPKMKLLLSVLYESIKNPLGALAVYFINHPTSTQDSVLDESFTTWQLSKTTKNL